MDNQVEILLAEDNPADAELALRALKKNNLANNIVWVKDGEEALDFLHGRGQYANQSGHQLPKVVLLDIKMPKVSGLEVLEEIRSTARLKHLPVVILSSSNQEKDLIESYNLGVNSYIVKPVEFDKFVEAVNQIGFYWLLLNAAPE